MNFSTWKLTAILCLGVACLGGWPLLAGDWACEEDAEACVEAMKEKLRHKGWVGIELSYEEEGGSPRILKVIENSPAAAAGLRPGDVLLGLDGVAYRGDNEEAVRKVYKGCGPGKTITYRISRDGSETEVQVVLAHVPDYLAAQWIGHHLMHYHSDKDSEETAKTP